MSYGRFPWMVRFAVSWAARLIVAAILSGRGDISFARLFFSAWAGAVFGHDIGYLIGRMLGHKLLWRYGGKIVLNAELLGKVEAIFARDGPDGRLRPFLQCVASTEWYRRRHRQDEVAASPDIQCTRWRVLGPGMDRGWFLSAHMERMSPHQRQLIARGRPGPTIRSHAET